MLFKSLKYRDSTKTCCYTFGVRNIGCMKEKVCNKEYHELSSTEKTESEKEKVEKHFEGFSDEEIKMIKLIAHIFVKNVVENKYCGWQNKYLNCGK